MGNGGIDSGQELNWLEIVSLTPAEHAFVYRVHDCRIRYDTHEVGAESSVQRPRTLFCDDSPQRLPESGVFKNAIDAWLSQPRS